MTTDDNVSALIRKAEIYLHNSLGAIYLEATDYARAEKHFRQALAIDPTEKAFKQNLFLALRHRPIRLRRARPKPKDADADDS